MGRREREKKRRRSAGGNTGAAGRTRFAGAGQWPVVRCWMPNPAVLMVCGEVTCGVARESPSGQLWAVMALVNFRSGGLEQIGACPLRDEKDLDDLLRKAEASIPCRYRSVGVELLSRVVWGAYGLSRKSGFAFAEEEIGDVACLLPQPAGKPLDWLAAVTGRVGGLVRPEFIERASRYFGRDLPEGKEIALLTTVTFRVASGTDVGGVLRECAPDFDLVEESSGRQVFSWSRAYPRSSLSPLRLLGGRQSLGRVTVCGDRMVAETNTSTWAGRFVDWAEAHLGDRAAVVDVAWVDPLDRSEG